jgi:steroid 5-alpha reductase family enzyme
MRGGDDPRYRQLHDEWGEDFRSRLFWFLQVQAVVAMALVLAIAVAAHRPGALQFSDLLGVAIFLAAIFGEATADRQLTKFGKDPVQKGRVCDVGLWGRSRHPNYFFEWCVWLAYIPIAIDWTGAYAWGWFVLIAPMLMYWLLVHVSGIPPLEAHMLRSRGDAFRAYQARVNAFWPGLNPSTKAMTQMDGKLP